MDMTLVVMAAGLGSRYGGVKQIERLGPDGEILMEYAIYDALCAGFDRIVLIIKPQMLQDVRALFGDRIEQRTGVRIDYAFQTPDRFTAARPELTQRSKPLGTVHAVLCARDVIETPFAVINADDFYGKGAYKTLYNYLMGDHPANEYAMVGYQVENTLTENGHVARGVCAMDKSGQFLTGIVERTHIEPRDGGAAFTEDDGKSFTFLPAGTVVSMNFWGFTPDILQEIEGRFAAFLAENLPKNPLKCEYFLPLIPNQLIAEGKAKVRVLPCPEKWYGVTYQPDMPQLQAAIARMKREKIYPDSLW